MFGKTRENFLRFNSFREIYFHAANFIVVQMKRRRQYTHDEEPVKFIEYT